MSEASSQIDLASLLRRTELLGGLLEEDFAYFVGRAETLALGAGELLFGAGSPAERFWVLSSGSLVVEREREAIARFGAGDVIGDFDFARGARRDATARCEEASELVAFPRRGLSLADLVTERPDASARLLLRSMAMISSRIRSVQGLISENEPWIRELRRQSHTDVATGLFTRSHFDELLSKSLEGPALFLLLKPDRFKELVDERGHGAGDEAMSAIARLLLSTASALGRGAAIRIKSNETALVVPRCDREEGRRLAQRLAQDFSRLDLGPSCAGLRLSLSMALGFWPEQGEEPVGLFDEVYGLLQRAWRDGGGRAYLLRSRPSVPPPGSPERRREGGEP